jgi:hypothetical protein
VVEQVWIGLRRRPLWKPAPKQSVHTVTSWDRTATGSCCGTGPMSRCVRLILLAPECSACGCHACGHSDTNVSPPAAAAAAAGGQVAAAICNSGLRIMPNAGGRLGAGIYLANQSVKSGYHTVVRPIVLPVLQVAMESSRTGAGTMSSLISTVSA